LTTTIGLWYARTILYWEEKCAVPSLSEWLNQTYPLRCETITRLREVGGAVYLVQARQGNYVLKLAKSAFSQTVQHSVDVLLFLERNAFPAPRVIRTQRGASCAWYGERLGVLCPFINGREPEMGERWEAIGALAGRLHQLMREYPGPLTQRGQDFFVERYLRVS
jgi:Ser/Thr protein kinase RdoA (MazF antagonist)